MLECPPFSREGPEKQLRPSLYIYTQNITEEFSIMSRAPVRVAITGAAGQIGYQLAFRIASGQMLGADQPVILQLLEIPPALDALKGVAMELDDCAFPTLHGVIATDQADEAFKDVDYALLVGAKPRGP